MKKIKKILIANRGEIAVRIIQAAKELNIISVAVFTEVDRMALHVQKADEVYPLVQNKIEPYLDINQIIDIAEKAGVDAIHPGYGFLSENAVFAKKVKEDGFIFIGPGYESIRLMGDKLLAKQMAIDVGIDVVPGCMVDDPSDPELTSKINHIGYPIMIKARAGGGGKGMRIVYDEDQFNEQLGQSIREAEAAFGDGSVFVEKYIEKPRHIEFQILADHHGNAVHLFERECSIQRRHQKIVEEAPSTILTKTERKEMGEAALRLVKACNYTNAGTLEFILDERKHFYFLEMNTRLQVEHPVTEYITGLDLVKQQIWIAEGKPLSFAQKDLKIHGHAIELRVCAEDPSNSFLPDIGILKKYVTPNGIGIRVDNGYTEGSEIPIEYDPLIAKLIAFGSTRDEAIARMKRAIIDFEIEGVKNTLDFGRFVMNNQHFFDGEFDTGFIAREMDKFLEINDDITESMIAALVSYKFVNKFGPIKIEDRPVSRNMWRERRK